MPEVVVRYQKDRIPEEILDRLMETLPQLVADTINAPSPGGGTESLTPEDVEVRDEPYTERARNAPDLGITLTARETDHRRQHLYDLIAAVERWLVENARLPAGTTYFVLPCLVESRFQQGVIREGG